MKVVVFSKSKHFINVTKITCFELDCLLFTVNQKDNLDHLLKNHDINLVIFDCDTFRPNNYNVLHYIQNLRKDTYCLVVETSLHEIDKDALLAQITKQCMLQEIYYYQQFVKQLYINYWNETEKKYLNKDLILNEEKIINKINYEDLFTVDENGIAIIKEQNPSFFSDSIVLGFGHETKVDNNLNYSGLEPISIKIFEFLKENINKPVSISSLCNHIWGESSVIKRNAIYVYIRKIRIYLGDNLDFPTKLLKSIKGFYILKAV